MKNTKFPILFQCLISGTWGVEFGNDRLSRPDSEWDELPGIVENSEVCDRVRKMGADGHPAMRMNALTARETVFEAN
ncbi:MAG: hypothetical protein HQM13_01085 [SAR324 cluster bacterium]|nr:hypothetical protein [SAR324 cluster bacterium]